MPAHNTPPHMRDDQDGDGPQADAFAPDPNINYTEWKSTGKGLASSARVTQDGRIAVSLNLKHNLPDLPRDYAQDVQEFAVDDTQWQHNPGMNIVIMIVGSRGDVQPYVALGQLLHKDGHRIRIATHETFRSFVTDSGLEFFNIGGDPHELMSYMVRNPGLMPGMGSLTNGDIGRKRKMLAEMMNGCWLSCFSPCTVTERPFTAHAIISNPPAFAHVHCAEALGVPVQLSFTMPWCPTAEFPHPLVNINKSNAKRALTNYLSYAMADILTWQGIGDIINDFRTSTLGLKPLGLRSGPGFVDRVKIPWTYCMSSALVPKPSDWANHIDVVGFYFLDLATSYQPPDDLAVFLAAGEPPIYIGFGSVVVDDAAAMTQMIFEATAQAGVRALVSAGWGGLGGVSVPSHIFILGNIPHDWLFDNERVSAVVHHGGAGTTAIGLAKGRPTVVVPFFGDQGFWGSMIHRAGAGPEPIPHKQLNVGKLADAIRFAISPSAKTAAKEMADKIRTEDGVRQGVDSFYKHLPLLNMRCDLDPSRVAIWWSTEHCIKLSAFAAQTLADAKLLDMEELDFHQSKDYDSQGPVEPKYETWSANAIFWAVTQSYAGLFDLVLRVPVIDDVKLVMKLGGGIKRMVSSAFADRRHKRNNSEDRTGGAAGSKSTEREPGKGKTYAYYDGVSGVMREPLNAKKDFRKAIKRSIQSLTDITVGPAAGVTSLVSRPLHALKRSTDTKAEHWRLIYLTRVSDGVAAVKNSSEAQRMEIIRRFNDARSGAEERREGYNLMAAKAVSTLGSPAGESSREAAGKADAYSQDDFEAYVGKPSVKVPVE